MKSIGVDFTGKMGNLHQMIRGIRNLFAVFTVWTMVVSMALATVPRVDCICPNGRTKIFCLSSTLNLSSCCQSAPTRGSVCGCCCGDRCQTCQVEDDGILRSSPTKDPTIQRKGCVKTIVAQQPANSDECQEVPNQVSAFSYDVSEGLTSERAIPTWLEDRFPPTRPPSSDLVILLQQFRN